jgi:outer membrane protein
MRTTYLTLAISLILPFCSLLAQDGLPNYDLKTCINKALLDNYQIRTARARIEQREGAKIAARASFFPSLDFKSGYQKFDEDTIPSFNNSRFGANKDWNLAIELSQTIYSGGRGTAQFKQQKRLSEAAAAELEETINSVILLVYQKYYGVLLAEAQRGVQEENVKLLEEELRLEKERLSAGTVSQFNVLRAEVALANGRVPLIRSKNDLRLAYEELAEVLGIEIASGSTSFPFRLEGALSFTPVTTDLSEALTLAQQRRPKLTSLEKNTAAAEQAVSVAQAEYLPIISTTGTYYAKKSPFTDRLGDDLRGWTVGAQAQWNLFNGLSTYGKVSEAKGALLAQQLTLAQERLAVHVEVRRAHSRIIEAQELVVASQKVVQQAEESLRLARERLSAGASPQIEVLDSHVALTEAKSNTIQALYDYNTARAELQRAIGTAVYNE